MIQYSVLHVMYKQINFYDRVNAISYVRLRCCLRMNIKPGGGRGVVTQPDLSNGGPRTRRGESSVYVRARMYSCQAS